MTKIPFDYILDESDPDIVILRRRDGSFVAAFSASGATKEGICEAAMEDYESCSKLTQSPWLCNMTSPTWHHAHRARSRGERCLIDSDIASASSRLPPHFLVPADTSLTLTECYNPKHRETPDRKIRRI